MQVSSLQDICSQFIANNFRKFSVERIKCLPRPVLRYLGYQLSPLHLRRLEVALDTPLEQNQDIWLSQYAKHFALYYRRMFRIGDSSENQFCVVSKTDGDFRRIFLEDHFHLLLEDANKITILLHRGVLEVNVDTVEEGKEKICPHVKMEQIKSDMLLCAPFVKSLRIFRSKVLTSSMFKDVLDLLIDSVVCIRLVFLHDYRIMRDTIEHFVKHGNILDLHTIWQPQRCSLPPKYSVDILTLIAGLQLPGLTPINDEPVEEDTLSWNPYDMYDYAVAGPILEDQANENLVMECAAVRKLKLHSCQH
ncbi:hypothetical protein EB796_009836 [Bugula neritina]|uniref:Uncharacterized protein n=1 Tax=Bugula neritina TaxID=10212 RepID=A0A7J7K1J2_BUGNE|nr:hypothetical protein EB796_009836 [Bugula neritina]